MSDFIKVKLDASLQITNGISPTLIGISDLYLNLDNIDYFRVISDHSTIEPYPSVAAGRIEFSEHDMIISEVVKRGWIDVKCKFLGYDEQLYINPANLDSVVINDEKKLVAVSGSDIIYDEEDIAKIKNLLGL